MCSHIFILLSRLQIFISDCTSADQANGEATIAWTMRQAKDKGQDIPDVVKEYHWNHELICKIKQLITAMTRYLAKDRMSLNEVYDQVQTVDKVK